MTRRQFLGGLLLAGVGGAACAGTGLLLWPDAPSTATAVPISNSATSVTDPVILPRTAWGALSPNHSAINEFGFFSAQNPAGWRVYTEDLQASYQTLVLHHSVIEGTSEIESLQLIQTLHREERRWADVGYHYFVAKSGRIYAGRDLNVRGVHVEGHNSGSLGLCLLGDYTQQEPPAAQINATRQLILWLKARLAVTHLATHRAFNANTLCPGPNLAAYLQPLATDSGLLIGTEGYIGPQAACQCGGSVV